MTKRLLSLLLVFILAIPILSLSVYADEICPYIDLKSAGYILVDGTIDTDFCGNLSDSDGLEIQFPVQFTGSSGYVELLIECIAPLSVIHTESGVELSSTHLGNNLYLYRGSVGTSSSEDFNFIGDSSQLSYFIHRARYYPTFTDSQIAKFVTDVTWKRGSYSSASSTYVSLRRQPEDICVNVVADWQGENYVVSGLFTDVYTTLSFDSSQLKGYDFLTIDFYTGNWALENVTSQVNGQPLNVTLGGFSVGDVDSSVYGTAWTYGQNRYTVDIDLRSIPYSNSSPLVVSIQGKMLVQASDSPGSRISGTFELDVYSAKKYITLDEPSSDVNLLVKIWQAIESLSSNLLRLFEDNEEIVDDFRDEQAKQETVIDEYINIIETSPTVNLDDVGTILDSVGGIPADEVAFGTILSDLMSSGVGMYILAIPIIMALFGYILYGKR